MMASRFPVARRGGVQASLAQSAERFHGKEKVVGSIPTGGSLNARSGGVAQLVRALGS